MRYQLHSKSLLGLCALSVVAAIACSDDFPTTNANSDYLVTLDVAEEHTAANEELTLICTVTHDGEPVSDLDVELRYTHLGADGGADEHASAKDVGGEPCPPEESGQEKDATGHDEPDGQGDNCEPENHIAMMRGEEPGTYMGTHTFEEAGNYEIEVEFEGHEGPELHHLGLEIEGADAH